MRVGRTRWRLPATSSIACWSWDARTTPALCNLGRGRGQCARAPDPCTTLAWVHAYLHRKEGDLANAAYWYRRAGRPMAREELTAEWLAIATALLGDV